MTKVREVVRSFCISEKILFGKYRLVDLLSNLPGIDDPSWAGLREFFNYSLLHEEEDGYACTGRKFIELKAQGQEKIQVELHKGKRMNSKQKKAYEDLQNAVRRGTHVNFIRCSIKKLLVRCLYPCCLP